MCEKMVIMRNILYCHSIEFVRNPTLAVITYCSHSLKRILQRFNENQMSSRTCTDRGALILATKSKIEVLLRAAKFATTSAGRIRVNKLA